ncbi:hypothetical protein CDAR_42671 [Caerostris darwini]|uniref:Uncharacterized protein n=1 Tax=Caerostris darwini TaxID=1538125 RepID=A0AAV4RVC3_9ARAC|nr:hypothetical protein CDAR_42671 [Caerostris darwini]
MIRDIYPAGPRAEYSIFSKRKFFKSPTGFWNKNDQACFRVVLWAADFFLHPSIVRCAEILESSHLLAGLMPNKPLSPPLSMQTGKPGGPAFDKQMPLTSITLFPIYLGPSSARGKRKKSGTNAKLCKPVSLVAGIRQANALDIHYSFPSLSWSVLCVRKKKEKNHKSLDSQPPTKIKSLPMSSPHFRYYFE